MAETDEKGSSAWDKVPPWDGNPAGFRAFKREMGWWQVFLDIGSDMVGQVLFAQGAGKVKDIRVSTGHPRFVELIPIQVTR